MLPSPPEWTPCRKPPAVPRRHGNAPTRPTVPTVMAPSVRVRVASAASAFAARRATANPARSLAAPPRTRCHAQAAPGLPRSRRQPGSGKPPLAPSGCPATLADRQPEPDSGSPPQDHCCEPGPDTAADPPVRSGRRVIAPLHTGSPGRPVAACRTPLVMVRESQTQTISLIRQGQRGTQIFLARNSGRPEFPNKLAGAAFGGWVFSRKAGSLSVLRCENLSFGCRCTWGESGRAAVQLSRVLGLSSGQAWALPPDKAAGGRSRDAVRAAAGDHPAGPHASARIV